MYKHLCYTFQSHLAKFHQNLPKVIKFCVIIGTFCYNWVIFIEISINSNNLLWYKSIHIIYRSFQDVPGYKIIKLHVSTNANIYLFCKLNLNTMNLKGPVKFKFHKSTIATHSTITDSQHREFLTFLTYFSICCFSTTCIFLTIHVILAAINCPIQATCEKIVPQVLRHAHLLLNNTQGLAVTW